MAASLFDFLVRFFAVLKHSQLHVEAGQMVDKEVLQTVAHTSVAIVEFYIEFIRHMLAGNSCVQPFFVELAQSCGHFVRPLVTADKVHEIRLNEQHLFFCLVYLWFCFLLNSFGVLFFQQTDIRLYKSSACSLRMHRFLISPCSGR